MNIKIAKMAWGFGAVCFACVLAACGLSSGSQEPSPIPQKPSPIPQKPSPVPQEPSVVTISRSYVLLNREELIDQADEIFLGQVQRISPTQWNQDSGEYWEETAEESDGRRSSLSARAYYEVEFSIIRSIVGTPNGLLTVMVGGKSPVDEKLLITRDGQTLEVQFDNDLQLQVGDRMIVFVQYNTIPWRDPSKPLQRVDLPDGGYYYHPGDSRSVLTFLQEPTSSLFCEGDDGLYHNLENASQRWEPFSLEELEQMVGVRREVHSATLLLTPGVPAATPTSICYECIVIQGITTHARSDITIRGSSTLPDGTCIQTQLLARGSEPQSWWPTNICATVQAGRWKLAVSLDEQEDAPAQLSDNELYTLFAWQQNHPSVRSQTFWFDFIGPPTPSTPPSTH